MQEQILEGRWLDVGSSKLKGLITFDIVPYLKVSYFENERTI
jgi:hypothetical protein